jgi:hypothetical protein
MTNYCTKLSLAEIASDLSGTLSDVVFSAGDFTHRHTAENRVFVGSVSEKAK